MYSNDTLLTLLEWCTTNSIFIDDRIQIRYHVGERTHLGVFSKDEFIPDKTTLVKIPKSAVLSTRSSCAAHLLPQYRVGLPAQLSLSLAVYIETLKETRSRFHGYLSSLPSGIVDLPMFWAAHGNCERTSTHTPDYGDGSAGLGWLNGTHAGNVLSRKTENDLTIRDEIIAFYHAEALPIIKKWNSVMATPDILGFYRAFSLVSSRAFLVDAFHGLAMVPVADAFNHVIENSIHLESDYDVCPECGSLEECSHDQQSAPTQKPSLSGHDAWIPDYYHNQHLEMVTNLVIPPHTEIFNTYGEHLDNAQLLNQYGFILDVNHNDRLYWSRQQILETLGLPDLDVGQGNDSIATTRDASGIHAGDLHAVCSALSDVCTHSPSQLACFDNEQYTSDDSRYCLNDEGNLSREFWALLFLLSLRHHRKTNSAYRAQSPTTVASSVWNLQIWVEDNVDLDGDIDEETVIDDTEEEKSQTTSQNPVPESPVLSDSLAQSILLQMSQWVVDLCGARKRCIGIPEASRMDLSDVMENLPDDYTHSRTAITIVMAERSILECCEGAWRTLHSTLTRNVLHGLGSVV